MPNPHPLPPLVPLSAIAWCAVVALGCTNEKTPRPSDTDPTGGAGGGGGAPHTVESTGGSFSLSSIEPVPLKSLDPVVVTLSAGEAYNLESCEFRDAVEGQIALNIRGAGAAAGNVVTIRDCLFSNVGYAIHIWNVEHVIVQGNRFEDVGTALRIQAGRTHLVEYNEIERFGVHDTCDNEGESYGGGGWCLANAVSLVHSAPASEIEIRQNLIDNSGIAGSQLNYTEDSIAVYRSPAASQGYIEGNKIRGHATSGSASGGGIVLDQLSNNMTIRDNIAVNTAQYGIGTANSDNILIEDNQVFLSWEHDVGLATHPHWTGGGGVVGMIASNYGAGECGQVKFDNNVALAETAREDGSAFWYLYNFWSDCPEDTLTFDNNTFTLDDSSSGPAVVPSDFGNGLLPLDMFTELDGNYFSGRRK